MRIFYRFLRFLSATTLFFFCWTYLSVWQVAAFALEPKAAPPVNGGNKAPDSSGDRFEAAVESIRENVSKAEEKEAKAQDAAAELESVKSKKAEIDALDAEVRNEFAATEKKIKDTNLPREILDRHAGFVQHYNDNIAELKSNLNAIEKAKTRTQLKAALLKAKLHLDKVKAPKKHVPLDPNNLPHRTVKPKEKAPRLKKEDFEKEFGPAIGNKGNPAVASAGFGIQDKGLETWIRDRVSARKPVQLAYSGPAGDIPLAFGSELSAKDEELINSLPDFSFSQRVAAIDAQPENILLAQVAADLPSDADLAETVEIQFTPEIRAKAQELNYNPVKIYEWVRHNIEFVPTYGSIQGADMCLQTKRCNAFDTASLLIALLRTSNIPARYVYGTVDVPIDKVMNWVGGFTDPVSAMNLIASGGIPVKGLTSGGKTVIARMEHAWVDAFVPYGNYRGAVRDESIKTWIPLDGSYKQYTYRDPIDFPSAVGFDKQQFLDEIKAASTVNPDSSVTNVPQDLILQRLQEYLQKVRQYSAANLQDKSLNDIIGEKKVITKNYGYLVGSLPYKPVVLGFKYSQLPDSLRWRVNFQVFSGLYSFDPDFSYTASTAFLAGKSTTLSYKPATGYDESLVQAYGYLEKVPPYLLKLKPQLVIEGNVAASGIPVGSGQDLDFVMTFISPDGSRDTISNKETVGAYLGVGFNLSSLSKSVLDSDTAEVARLLSDSTPDAGRKIQECLHLLTSFYFSELDAMNALEERFAKVVDIRHPSSAIVGTGLKVSTLWGSPRSLSFAGLFIDVDRDVHSTIARDGDKNKALTFTVKSGYNGSSIEHALWEQLYKLPGISAVKIHHLANQRGIPIYKIDRSNSASLLPQLQISNADKSDIANAVNAGKTVYVPQQNIQYYDWYGTAYIVMDADSGAAGYIISGGHAGGTAGLILDCLEALIQLIDLIPLPGVVGIIAEILAFAATIHDITQSSAPPENQNLAVLLAVLSLIMGLASTFIPIPWFIVLVVVLEIIMYISVFYLLEGGWPIIDENPVQACVDLF